MSSDRRVWIGGAALALGLVAAGVMSYLGRPGVDPRRLSGEVHADLESGRWDRAEAGLKRLSRLGPAGSDVWMLRALLAEGRGRIDEAVADLGHIPDGDPLGHRARLKEGELERGRHRFRAAEAALRRALKSDPRLKLARLNLIYLDGVKLRQADLRARFLELAAQGPLTFVDLSLWCRDWDVVEKPEETAAVLGPVVAADPGDREARLVLVEALRLLGRGAEAEAALAVLPESDPDARSARALLAIDRGDESAADSLLSGGPADHPGLALLRGRRALARRDGGEAVRQFETALAAAPDDRRALFGLGHALRLAGRGAEAGPPLQRARALDALSGLAQRAEEAGPSADAGFLLRFGAACEALGRVPEARGWYSLVISADPLNSVAQKALFRLGGSG